MTDVLTQPAAHALARALGHFVWQGAAIGLVVLVAFRIFRASASTRYLIGVSGLVAMLAAPVLTFVILVNEPQPTNAPVAPAPITAPLTVSTVTSQASLAATIAQSNQIDWQATVLLAWLVGAAAFTLRLTGGWIVARRFATRAVQPASEHIADVVGQLADRMNIRRAIAVVESAAVSVPVMIGWLKPTIVLPIAALAGLSPSQIEALIAHELAHVKRHDYLVNLLQSTVEALLFYHPAVWWLSRRVRAERELCCDDLALGVCDRLVYATALTDLASLSSPRIALAATDGDLLGRVRRILGRGQTSPAAWPGLAPLLTLAFVAAIVVPATFASATPVPQHPGTIIAAIGDESGGSVPEAQPQTKPSPSPSPAPSPAPASAEVSATGQEFLRQQVAEAEKKIQFVRRQIEEAQALNGQKPDQASFEAALKALQQQLERMKTLQEKGLVAQAQVNEVQAAIEKVSAEKAAMRGNEVAAHETDLKALEQQLERMKALQEKGLVAQSQIAEVQTAMQKAAAQGDEKATREVELKALQQQVERTQELFQKGLVAQSQLADAKAALDKAFAQGDAQAAAATALRQAQITLERSKSLAEKGLISSAALADAERAVAAAEQQLLVVQARAAEKRNREADVQTPRPTQTPTASAGGCVGPDPFLAMGGGTCFNGGWYPPGVFPKAAGPELSQKHRLVQLDSTTPAQAGNILNLTITNEPTLPGVYIIGEDGTIRLPFVGSIKVAGLTAAQVREAIGKKLAEKKLGSIDSVTVTILRGQ